MHEDDWRVQFVGSQVGTGNRVAIAVQGVWDSGINIVADMPSPACLMLDISSKLYHRSTSTRQGMAAPALDGAIDDQEKLFDYIQDYFSSIILAFTAIEMACNTHIRSDDTLTLENRRSTETFTGEQIERWVSLDEKIVFVADRLGAQFDRGGSTWQNYKKLVDMRNRLVHLKNADRESHGCDADNIWTFALCQSPINPVQIALKVLNEMYAAKLENAPQWLSAANSELLQ